VNLDFADALGRRLLSARHLAEALRLPALVLADMCDDTVGMVMPTRPTAEDYFFFAFRFIFFAAFAFFAFLAFFAITALLAMIEMAISEQCSRESTCTAHRLLQHAKKNSESA
jgi:hypothetical protein